MVNEAQKRRLSITLKNVEEQLFKIEQRLKSDDHVGMLYELRNDLPLPLRENLLAKMVLIKEEIGKLAEQFALDKETEMLSSNIFGTVSILWVSLDEIRAKRLRVYGAVAEGLEDTLDPELDMMMNQIFEMEHTVDMIRQRK